MQIIYKKDNKDKRVFKFVSAEFCCEQASEAWEDRAVIFGEADTVLNFDNNVNILKCSPYPEGAVFTEYSISFCPFCGKSITVKEEEN